MDLFKLRDEKYAAFQSRIIPDRDPGTILGIRTPVLRNIAKDISGTAEAEIFMKELPHEFFEQDQIHAFLIARMKDPAGALEEIDRFLPFVDNWATTDQMNPRCLAKDKKLLMRYIRKWIKSKHPFTVRFGIKMLMDHFLKEDFDPSYLDTVAGIRSDHYYVKMMKAWYFATVAAFRPENMDYILRLEPDVRKKAIQKALESYRVSDENKELLMEWRKQS